MSDTKQSKNGRIITLIQKNGMIRPREVEAIGISRVYLYRMVDNGIVERVSSGLYGLPDHPIYRHSSQAEVMKRVPHGVISLISALHYHELTTQLPHEVWLTVEAGKHTPKISYPPVRLTRFSGKSFTHGIETHNVDGVDIRVYSIAKTLVDCFKFRNTVGIDVAMEAMRDVFLEKRATMSDIWKAAKVCRMTKVMMPYLQMVGMLDKW